MERVRRLLEALAGPVRAACERAAPTGAHGRAQRALAQLHLGEKKFTHTDNLMLPTLGTILILAGALTFECAFLYCLNNTASILTNSIFLINIQSY